MNRLFITLVLLLISGVVFADPTGALTHGGHFPDTLTPPSTDYSVAYLSQIFGTVGNVLQGTSGQILGKIFEIFNKGVLVVAAIWLGYTTITIALRAAGEGSFMGQNRNVHLILLRIALGFALIIPSSTTGYSLLQDLFMKIVVAGVGLADQTWDAALNYIKYGGELYIPPAGLSNDTGVATAALSSVIPQAATNTPPTSGLAPVAQVFVDEVCMLESKDWEKLSSSKTYIENYHPIFHENQGVVYFPGVGNSHDDSKVGTGSGQLAPQCGVATSYYEVNKWANLGEVETSTVGAYTPVHENQNEQLFYMKQYSFSALKQLVLSTLPAAREWVKHGGGSDMSDSDRQLYIKNNEKAIFSAILAYGNLITPYQHMLTQDQMIAQQESVAQKKMPDSSLSVLPLAQLEETDEATKIKDNQSALANRSKENVELLVAKREGWIMAGSFYWTLEKMNESAKNMSISQLFPSVTPPPIYTTANNNYATTLYNAATAVALGYPSGVTSLWHKYIGAQQNNYELLGQNGQGAISSSDLAGHLTGASVSSLRSVNDKMSLNSHYNPIVVLMNEGTRLLTAVVAMWIAAITITVAVAVFAGICDASSPGGLIVQTIVTWMKTILMLISVALLLPGAILAYYVPLYPFIIFTFAAIGWISMVVEGMAAAPLVCIGLTHPEGQEFLGKAEQALMLFLSIFLRPALMIIGLVAAMVVSFVVFHMMITGFFALNYSLTSNAKDALNSGLLWLLSFTIMMVIFGMLTMEVVEQCYKLIYQLPNTIMQWIGAPQNQMAQDYSQLAQGVRGAVSSTASSMGQTMQGIDKANSSFEQLPGKAKESAGGKDASSGKIEGDGGGGSQPPPVDPTLLL